MVSDYTSAWHIYNRPFHGFFNFDMDKLGKIHRHHWKECLKISRIAKFENGLSKTNEDIGPQSLKNYRHLYGGGTNLLSTIQTSVNFSRARDCTCTFVYLHSLKMYHCQIWQFHYFQGALFSGVDRFSLSSPCQKLKNCGRVFFFLHLPNLSQAPTWHIAWSLCSMYVLCHLEYPRNFRWKHGTTHIILN